MSTIPKLDRNRYNSKCSLNRNYTYNEDGTTKDVKANEKHDGLMRKWNYRVNAKNLTNIENS